MREEVEDITVLVVNTGVTLCYIITEFEDEEIQLIIDVNYLSHY